MADNRNTSLGPVLTDSDFRLLISNGEKMAAAAGTERNVRKFAAEPSYIAVESKPAAVNCGILAVDVGGTHVKIGLRTVSKSGQTAWREIIDINNDSLNTTGSEGKGLNRMATELGRVIGTRLTELQIPKVQIAGVGVVWSNQLTNSPISGSTKGVTGIVTGVRSGNAYRKGEWWNQDIDDGDDVGEIFIQAFRSNGFSPRAFVIGNDTIFTAKAVDRADSGMVASTGANATIIPAGQNMLCNSESGGHFEVLASCLGLPSVNGVALLKLEDAIAGLNMPQIFCEYVIQAASQGQTALTAFAELIKTKRAKSEPPIKAPDLSAIVKGQYDKVLGDKFAGVFPGKVQELLTQMARSLMDISGKLAAAMAWFSVYNQLEEKDEFVIALDSSQARFQEGYFDSMKRTIQSLMAAKGKQALVRLLEPEGEISVPMIGVARATNDFL